MICVHVWCQRIVCKITAAVVITLPACLRWSQRLPTWSLGASWLKYMQQFVVEHWCFVHHNTHLGEPRIVFSDFVLGWVVFGHGSKSINFAERKDEGGMTAADAIAVQSHRTAPLHCNYSGHRIGANAWLRGHCMLHHRKAGQCFDCGHIGGQVGRVEKRFKAKGQGRFFLILIGLVKSWPASILVVQNMIGSSRKGGKILNNISLL